MYLKIIRKILETRFPSYAQDNNLSEEQVLLEIRQKIDHTSGEYWSENPQIDYAWYRPSLRTQVLPHERALLLLEYGGSKGITSQ